MKLFVLILSLATVCGQGYYFNVNGTSFSAHPMNEITPINGLMPSYEYNDVLRHYRSDTRKREPQFLGFAIQDDNIEVSLSSR